MEGKTQAMGEEEARSSKGLLLLKLQEEAINDKASVELRFIAEAQRRLLAAPEGSRDLHMLHRLDSKERAVRMRLGGERAEIHRARAGVKADRYKQVGGQHCDLEHP